MLNFLKHIYQKHSHTALAILILILIFMAVPNEDISMLPHVDARTAQRVMNIGKLSFQGVGSGFLELSGRFYGDKKVVYNIVINEEQNGIKSFKWNRNDGFYTVALLTDKELILPDGVTIKFDPKLAYQVGDNWTINTGIPARVNLASKTASDTGRFLASLYTGRSNLARQATDGFLAVSSTPEALPQGLEKALFDINISPAGVGQSNRFWFATSLLILIVIFVLVFWLIKNKKRLILSRKVLKKILVVEDELDMRQAIVEVLKHAGFKVLEATDGEQGLNLAIFAKPDLILIDILMPKMDGMEMMKKLRELGEWGKKVPIILLTNLSADEKIMQSIIQDEPIYYLIKSDWKITDVLDKVHRALNNL